MTNEQDCVSCEQPMKSRPTYECTFISHWETYAIHLEDKMELDDEERDKLDVAEWLERYQKVKGYDCHGCGRHYEIPTHLTHITCVCGHRCRLRHLGGTDPSQAVIDAAITYFGNERSAQLAWIAEVIASPHAVNRSVDEIRKMIQQELDRWELTETGWSKKK